MQIQDMKQVIESNDVGSKVMQGQEEVTYFHKHTRGQRIAVQKGTGHFYIVCARIDNTNQL